MPFDLDWLIVGGGVHGTLASHFLTRTGAVPRDRLRVLDPHDEPLAVWERCSQSVGMRFMRSPSVHHLDLAPSSMRAFAGAAGLEPRCFAEPYHRPLLDVFDAHCAWVIERNELHALRLRGQATGLEPEGEGYRVHTEDGPLRARRVVLALGSTHALAWPAWARALRPSHRVEHVLEPGFSRHDVGLTDDVAIVGGAISATQLALALVEQPGRTGRVVVLARGEPKIRQFDVDPGWLGPRYLEGFGREPCLHTRRQQVRKARGGGTIPPQEWRRARLAITRRSLGWQQAEIAGAQVHPRGGRIELQLHGGDGLRVDRVLLATGFDRQQPFPTWLDHAAEALALPRAPCGYPVVDARLQWAPGLFVTGPGAELELGPAARNVWGARAAAGRLVRAA